MYSVTHDAVHGIASCNRRLNAIMGRICAFHEGITFPIFKLSHMMHHRFTNHPEKDPDFIIGRKPRLLLPVWMLVRLLHDNTFMVKQRLWKGRSRYFLEHLLTVCMQVGYFFGLSQILGATTTLWIWLIPLATAGMVVELLVAWFVHYPQESQDRFEHTRFIKSRIFQVLMFNHNLHIVHHFWPKVPWFAYGDHVADMEHLIAEKLHGKSVPVTANGVLSSSI
jgi:beta-carotene hydroxylase